MKETVKRVILLCGTCAVLLAGHRAIPVMQAVTVGGVQQEPEQLSGSQAASEPTENSDSSSEESGTVTQPVLHAPAEIPQAETAAEIINIESDGSKAMWYSRLYQPGDAGDGGDIIDRHFGAQSGTMFLTLPGGGQVRNSTFWSNDDLLEESRIMPELPLKTDGSPMVLIYHTHTTESYVPEKTGRYDESFNFRTTEPDCNMVTVGDAIAEQLAAAGIGVIHAREIHDFPVWTGSYSNSAATVSEILAQYPSVCIALDIHRDAISDGETVIAPVAEIDGKQSAQIMIISGCDDGTMGMPDYRRNFHFASRLQETAETMFPGLTRPILFDYRKYNQDLTAGSLLIEVGSQGNTLEEARYAGMLTGQALGKTLIALAESNC